MRCHKEQFVISLSPVPCSNFLPTNSHSVETRPCQREVALNGEEEKEKKHFRLHICTAHFHSLCCLQLQPLFMEHLIKRGKTHRDPFTATLLSLTMASASFQLTLVKTPDASLSALWKASGEYRRKTKTKRLIFSQHTTPFFFFKVKDYVICGYIYRIFLSRNKIHKQINK